MSEISINVPVFMEIWNNMTFSNTTNVDPEISENYKKRLAMIRQEVKEGKYTDYENTEELAKKYGL